MKRAVDGFDKMGLSEKGKARAATRAMDG